MDNLSHYESRTGTLSCSPREVFDFVTDIRNFEQFIPQNSISNWQSSKETCSFSVSMVGTVSVRLEKKEEHNKVIFSGDALKKNDFSLILNISEGSESLANVKVLLEAELNPMLKMMASKPIIQFLEMLIREMESFREWKNIIK
jgi:ribosome-associated toxin RatA of RatAB toxin-antitoxin module